MVRWFIYWTTKSYLSVWASASSLKYSAWPHWIRWQTDTPRPFPMLLLESKCPMTSEHYYGFNVLEVQTTTMKSLWGWTWIWILCPNAMHTKLVYIHVVLRYILTNKQIYVQKKIPNSYLVQSHNWDFSRLSSSSHVLILRFMFDHLFLHERG